MRDGRTVWLLAGTLALAFQAMGWPEPTEWERAKLQTARQVWQNESRVGDGWRTRKYDWQIEETLRRGQQGSLSWEQDFARLMEDRRRAQENARAIEAARWAWDSERFRGRSRHTYELDRTIQNTLDNAEWDDTGMWRLDFDRQLRTRRAVREQMDDPMPQLSPPPLSPPLGQPLIQPLIRPIRHDPFAPLH